MPAILLARITDGHDWYAAEKLTAVEIALAIGFSEYTVIISLAASRSSATR